MKRSSLVQTILQQLNVAADEYTAANEVYITARVEYELARERFAKTKDMAWAMIGQSEWMKWSENHPNLEYTGTALGTAITGILGHQAWITASEYDQKSNKRFNPALDLESISRHLEQGGYEFKSTAPLRETNAALMKLNGVAKTRFNTYQINEAESYLEYFKIQYLEEEPPPDDVDDLPLK